MVIEKEIAVLLTKSKKTLSIAESCTGGLVSSCLTDISGSSKFLKLSIVAYSNSAKMKLLKVPAALLKKHGAVSHEVAIKMSKNVRNILNTNFGIAITGIAGPTGATLTKPVGLTFISASSRNKIICQKYRFNGSRKEIKQQAVTQALIQLKKLL